jgi:hypothetical protein
MPKPALYFTDVGYVIFRLFLLQSAYSTKRRDGSHVTARFTPILRAYITSDYQETAIIRGAIDTPAVWMEDLASLPQSTTWNLTRDPASGRYTMLPA